MLANGFATLCENFNYKSFILTETHRLLKKSADLTSIFYHTPIKSVADFKYELANTTIHYILRKVVQFLFLRRCLLVKADKGSCDFTIRIVNDLLSSYPKLNIAVINKISCCS